jgi:hypothetical protein
MERVLLIHIQKDERHFQRNIFTYFQQKLAKVLHWILSIIRTVFLRDSIVFKRRMIASWLILE